MTAYVNDEQKKEGAYGKAVKATLAATLAAGMVPAAAAFAEEPAEAAEGNDVELLALSATDAWLNGKFVVADNHGRTVEFGQNADGSVKPIEFEADGRAHYLVPKTVDPEGPAGVEDLTDSDRYTVTYYDITNSTAIDADDLAQLNAVGEYKVTVTSKNAEYPATSTKDFYFNIVAGENKVEKAEFYQIGAAGDFSDKTFEYAGEDLKAGIGLVYNGKKLEQGEDYQSIAFYDAVGNAVTNLVNSGTYTAVITVDGKTTVKKNLTISKIDLSKAKFTFATDGAMFAENSVAEINGKAAFFNGKEDGQANTVAVADLFDIKLVSMPDVTNKNALGEYVWSVTPKALELYPVILANFEGVGNAVNINAEDPIEDAWFKYDGKEMDNVTVDRSKGNADFDLSKISVLRDGNNKLDKSFYTVTVLDQAGNEVDAAKLKETGVWTVKVAVDSKATGYLYAGERSVKVTVLNGAVLDDEIAFAFDGKAAYETVNPTYTGEDFLSKLEVSVKLGDKELVKGEDYTLKAVDEDNNVVDSIVEAGTYTVSVESDKYALPQENSITIDVALAEAKFVRIAPASLMLEGDDGLKVVYTGEAIAPKLQYTTDADLDAETEWKDLPADAAALTFQYAKKVTNEGALVDAKAAKEMKELGFYTLAASDADANDSIVVEGVKFADMLPGADGELEAKTNPVYQVVEGKVFADVKPGDWYYDYVYAASDEKVGYMTGIGGTELFAPNQTTSRAMAATVLSRMAVKGGAEPDDYTNPFTDVIYTGVDEKDPWYAEHVLWAASTGIVTGYPGTTEFRPDANVNRAEFCIMMQRYAAATDQGVALETGEAGEILAKYEDGASVPAWAKDAVAWAVKNEIFGGYKVLDPMGDITRAQMAKMAVAFQAEPLEVK